MAKSVTREFADYTVGLEYEAIPEDVGGQMKRLLLDSLACAIAAFDEPPARISRQVARQAGAGLPEATIMGEDTKVSVSQAIIANETMVRFWDFNDTYHFPKGAGNLGAAHPSDILPAALALGERENASGRKVLEAAVAGYEVMGRMIDSFSSGLEPIGFHHGSVMAYSGAAIAGKILDLDAETITHAMGIGGAAANCLGILDAEGEEYNNTKNIVDGFMVERGVYGAFLAQAGFTGPERIIEGNKGFAHCLLRGAENYTQKPLTDDYYTMRVRMKYYPVESTNQAHLYAIGQLVRENDLSPDDIENIHLRLSKRTVFHNGDPAKKYPRNKETADHSVYFMAALGVVTRGDVVPSCFNSKMYNDPTIHRLIEKVTLEHGPEFDATIPAAKATITTTDGRKLERQIDFPKGNPENRMTDDEIRRKLDVCVAGRMSEKQVDRIVETTLDLEKLDSIADLMPQLRLQH